MFTLLLSALLSCSNAVVTSEPPPADTGEPVECTPEGGELWGKSESAYCCEGLVQTQQDPYDCDAGEDVAGPDGLLCVACGDGACGLMETWCNCPDDCDEGEVGPTE
jgi:hypothetical protein